MIYDMIVLSLTETPTRHIYPTTTTTTATTPTKPIAHRNYKWKKTLDFFTFKRSPGEYASSVCGQIIKTKRKQHNTFYVNNRKHTKVVYFLNVPLPMYVQFN